MFWIVRNPDPPMAYYEVPDYLSLEDCEEEEQEDLEDEL